MAKYTEEQKQVRNKVGKKVDNIVVEIPVVIAPIVSPVLKDEPKITFGEFTYKLDNTMSRVLKSYANVESEVVEKTKSEWNKLLNDAKNKPIR